jgi:CTD nuclear envelope phosphatase 1
MNSLTYISRQLDVRVLGAPRAPPSTPTSEHPPHLRAHGLGDGGSGADSDAPADSDVPKRVRTWSKPLARALDAAVPGAGSGRSTPPPFRRSQTSPNVHNAVLPLAPAPAPAPEPVLPPPPPPPPVTASTPSRTRALSVVKASSEPRAGVLRRMIFVRMFAEVWNTLCDVWATWAGVGIARLPASPAKARAPKPRWILISDDTTDEKDSEDEMAGEKAMFLRASLGPSVTSRPTNHEPIPLKPALDRSRSEPGSAETSPVVPAATPRKTPFHLPKTLVLDLDETLIHSTTRPMTHLGGRRSGWLGWLGVGGQDKGAGRVVEVVLHGRSTLYHVYKRPFVDYFLRKVREAAVASLHLLTCTSGLGMVHTSYLHRLHARVRGPSDRLVRCGHRHIESSLISRGGCSAPGAVALADRSQSCTFLNGQYAKDLSIVEADLSRVCLLDNSPVCYSLNECQCRSSSRIARVLTKCHL